MAGEYDPPSGEALSFDFTGGGAYQAPEGNEAVFHFWRRPPYQAPLGSVVGLNFDPAGYVAPTGSAVGLEFVRHAMAGDAQDLFGVGHDSLDLGGQSIRLGWRGITVDGFNAIAYGTPSAYNLVQFLRPSGYYRATGFGVASTRNLNRFVLPSSIGNAARYGVATLINRNQNVLPAGFSTQALGLPRGYNTRQYVALTSGIAERNGYGVPRAWNFNPEAFAAGFDSAAYGRPSTWNSLRFVRAGSAPSRLVFGLPGILNLNRTLPLPSIPQATGYGRPDIRNKNRELRPPTLGSFAVVGLHHTWNKTQTAWTAPAARGVAYGRPAILNLNRYYAFESAGDFAALGEPSIWNRNYWLTLGNIAPPLPGAPYIWNRNQFVRTSAITPRVALGAPTIWNRNQFLRAYGSNMAQFGVTQLTHEHRTIIVWPAPYPPTLPAGHSLSMSLHQVRPQLLNALQMGWQHAVYSDRQEVFAEGFDTLEWGSRIIPVHREVEIAGWHSMKFANPQQIYSTTHSIKPAGFATHEQPWLRWGTNTVWNWRQHVTLYYDPDADTNGERWPLWTKIENRNRVMRTHSTDGAKVSRPEIYLKSRLLFPGGIASPEDPEFYKAGSVTHWLQRVLPEGLYGRMGTWMIVYYGQGRVRPVPMADFAAVPEPTVVNTRRYYRWVGRIDGSGYGHPFVAYGVRTITCEARFGLEPPLVRLPRIENSDQYVEPVGVEPRGFGLTNLHIYWATIRPRWQDDPLFGTAKAHNATPEIHTAGRAFDRFGRPSARLQWRPVVQVWSDAYAVFGKQLIGYRTRHIEPSSADYLRLGIIADIEGGRREIPTNRILLPNGIGAPAVPAPRSSIWTVRVSIAASDGHRFGSGVRIWANSLYPRSIQWLRFIGNPFVRHGYVPSPDPGAGGYPYQPPSGDHGEDNDTYVPPPTVEDRRIVGAGGIATQNIPVGLSYKVRVSPHTVYAPSGDEATAQARANHPTGDEPKPIIGMALGVPRFHHWLRYVDMKGADFAPVVGAHHVQLLRRYIKVQGWYRGRHGWQWVKGGAQLLEQYDPSGPSAANDRWVGRPGVRDPYAPPPPPPKPTGFDMLRFGSHDDTSWNRADPRTRLRVELKNRTLPLAGWNSMVMGKDSYRSGPNDYYTDPYRYPHRLTVYFPRPAPMNGFHTAQYGTPWVSFRVRDLGVRGFDPLVIDYDDDHFGKRMRVIRVLERQQPDEQSIAAQGFDSFEASIVGVMPMTHYIRPDGNSDQYRKGAF